MPLPPLRSDGPVFEWTDRHQCSSSPRTFLKEYCAMRVWLITQMVFRRWIISARHSDNLSVRFMFMQEKQEGNDLAAQWLTGDWSIAKKSYSLTVCSLLWFGYGSVVLKSRFVKNREHYWSNLPQNSNFGRELVQKSGVQISVKEGQTFFVWFSFHSDEERRFMYKIN